MIDYSYRMALKEFIWRVMQDDHVVAFKAIESCENDAERRLLIKLVFEKATIEKDEEVLRWIRKIFGGDDDRS